MAAIKLPKFASDINLDVPREQMLAESAYALKHVENHLVHHLWIGRTLAAAKQELRADGVNQNDGAYSAALNRWIAEHQPKLANLHKNLRADSIWCIENWPNVQPYLKRIEQEDPRLHQMLGARGLRERVEKAMSNLDQRKKPLTPKPSTPAQLLNMITRDHRNMGLAWSETGGPSIANYERLQNWIDAHRDWAFHVNPVASVPPEPDAAAHSDGTRDAPPAPEAGDPGPTGEEVN